MNKEVLADPQALSEVCPHLNSRQILALLQRFKPDELAGDPVPRKVVNEVEKLAKADEKKQGGGKLPVFFDTSRVSPPSLD